MQEISDIAALRAVVKSWRQAGLRVGFVPTMGNLHAGHLALLKQAVRDSDRVVASIFVNPLQFNVQADLEAYPRTLQDDRVALESTAVDVLFCPDEVSMYPQGRKLVSQVEVMGLSDILEGAARPGHFVGMTTVVTKLFNCVQPDLAVFGEKDFQQLLLVRRLVADLNMPVEIRSLATVREDDGLAMSSRNQRLSEQERKLAPTLYQQLCRVRESLGEENIEIKALEQAATEYLTEQGFIPEYFVIRDADSLSEVNNDTRNRVILVAVGLGDTRLIDNLRV